MGRVKLKIQRLETLNSRQVTYGKRRAGILKKAQEISVLCDIPIVLIMFSPSGKPSIFCGQRSNIDEMIAKYAQLTPKERAKRRLESLETLKRNFKKLDQDVDIEEFLDASTPSIEEMQNRVTTLQAQLAEAHERIRWWSNPDTIEDIEHLDQMENSLRESLNRTHITKEKIFKEPLIQFDCTSQVCGDFGSVYEQELPKPQFANSMQFPLATSSDQDCVNQSWLPGGEGQHMMLSGEPQFLGSRDMECSDYFPNVKEQDLENSREMKNERRLDLLSVDDYSYSAHMRPPLGDQYPYNSFGNLSFPDLIEPGKDVNFQLSSLGYQINGNFDFPHSLVPNAGPCAISMLDDNSYHPPPDCSSN
ncbi:agamous-like MADS-box protein AGL65 [Salvia hispanica]|uniref:agamous-like MADS-box protein AGL65 n=1 Tax=Salvia hispanica TaxID=49212 RepID=UPI002008FE23|nr:agamous-like MADS-box protein AGL65 [Salvia hispanica]XP_047954881.1 agamous-like MADS-box protein AGL65 [Salvia hispanica]XP_047954883.1 agamous-like MADS-box protein AGL65 [Salvia hispanica]XP_047954884.1 agamous-like MADS-box protein AGL65 [Salvia hispanica]XP_047954885.1 agamous-like MADS-box protein AGL65 [Salvia hispanica]XP_047982547.1 agamous-like MADS-box protein AGL65 [Salvia hispanica]XP_047982555.1 agamous-like MADS-box protein AGL65 [Salvia hispanica]XP_047982564.1 agamous-li